MKTTIKSELSSQKPFFFAIPALVWQSLLCLLPLFLIALSSFFIPLTWQVSLKNYAQVFSYVHAKIIFSSLVLAFVTTLNCLILGYPISFWLARKVSTFKNLFLFLLIVPFWTNLLVLVYSWIFILEPTGMVNSLLITLGIISKPLPLLNSLFAIGLVTFYCYLPFMVLPIFSALEKIDDSVLEASADLGANWWQTFFKVIVPMSWPGIRTGILLVFVPVFGEFTIPLLMGGDKYMFVGNTISHYVFIALNLSQGAAFTIVSSILLVISVTILSIVTKRVIYRL